MFDDGENTITMFLPEIVKNLEEEKKRKSIIETVEEDVVIKAHDEDDIFWLNSRNSDHYESKRSLFSSSSEEKSDDENHKMFDPEIRDYSIESWNGGHILKQWDKKNEQKPCNTLRGAYDGTLFPQNISQSNTINVYRKAFCRTLPITYSHSGRQWGFDAYWFTLAENAFVSSPDDPETECYCQEDQCLQKGLGDISPCYYGESI